MESLRELSLFAGAGGGILGGHLLGWRTVCAVELEPYAAGVLLQRQNDGILQPFPVWDDVCTFDGKPWRGIVDVISGGFPCQDISAAGKGAGITGERSGLWKEFARIICEVRPRFVFVENSPMLTSRGLDTVLRDLAALGYDAEWGVLGAVDAGAPHVRERIWIVAYADKDRRIWTDISLRQGREKECIAIPDRCCQTSPYPSSDRLEGKVYVGYGCQAHGNDERGAIAGRTLSSMWQGNNPEPGILGMDDGMANWMDRISASGNGQVPAVVALAWRVLRAKGAEDGE